MYLIQQRQNGLLLGVTCRWKFALWPLLGPLFTFFFNFFNRFDTLLSTLLNSVVPLKNLAGKLYVICLRRQNLLLFHLMKLVYNGLSSINWNVQSDHRQSQNETNINIKNMERKSCFNRHRNGKTGKEKLKCQNHNIRLSCNSNRYSRE